MQRRKALYKEKREGSEEKFKDFMKMLAYTQRQLFHKK